MRNRLLLIALSLCLLPLGASAQQTLEAGQNYYDDDQKGIVYEGEWSIDLRLLTPRALALGVNIGRILSYDRTRFFNIEIGNLRHPQEYRQSFDQFFTNPRVSRSFVYGKQNNAYLLRGGVGEKRYFSEKAKNRGLAIGVSYQVGANLGLIKPYHLELIRSNETGPAEPYISTEPYSVDNANLFLDLSRIVGAASFSEGLTDLQVMPGFHLKAAAHFDWGAFDEFVKAIEAGINVDVFFKDVPIMVENELVPHLENRPIFLNLYLNLQLGKRW
jgi:hypothetical protein